MRETKCNEHYIYKNRDKNIENKNIVSSIIGKNLIEGCKLRYN